MILNLSIKIVHNYLIVSHALALTMPAVPIGLIVFCIRGCLICHNSFSRLWSTFAHETIFIFVKFVAIVWESTNWLAHYHAQDYWNGDGSRGSYNRLAPLKNYLDNLKNSKALYALSNYRSKWLWKDASLILKTVREVPRQAICSLHACSV